MPWLHPRYMETPTKILVATLTTQRPDELAIIPLLPFVAASSLNATNGTTMELPSEHTALHGFELARIPERRGPFGPDGVGEHTSPHGFELVRVPERR